MVLVSIIGDYSSSVLPIFYEFKNNINKHIVIYDKSKKDTNFALDLIAGTKNIIKKYNLNIKTIIQVIDEDSLDRLNKLADFILETSKNKKLYINITDGLANIATILSFRLMSYGANFISYDRFDNTANVLNKKGMLKLKLKSTPIIDHFLLKNIEIVDYKKPKFAKKFKNELELLFTKYSGEFKGFTKKFKLGSYSKKEFPNVLKILKKMGYDEEKLLTVEPSVFDGNFFEYYIASKIYDLDVDDILINAQLIKKLPQNKKIKNEFDILIMKDNHLHMIECKYKKAIKKKEFELLIYKYSTLKHFLDDDGKNILLYYKAVLQSEQSNLFHRAKYNDILLIDNITKNDFVLKIKEFLNL